MSATGRRLLINGKPTDYVLTDTAVVRAPAKPWDKPDPALARMVEGRATFTLRTAAERDRLARTAAAPESLPIIEDDDERA